jgi:hypothetical protein
MTMQTSRAGARRGARQTLATLAACALALLAAGATACDGDDDPVRPAEAAELDRARAATERYQDVSRAIADGYVDAKIVSQSMGHHYLNASLLDDRFEPDRPELLVYAPEGGRLRLVAVEYAVPLDRAATAPAGFTGAADTWDRTTKYGLWTLHAWLWLDNAAGVFTAQNARVQLDPGTIQGDAGHAAHGTH